MANKDIRGIFKEIAPKLELKDYSGPLKPDLRYSDFSKEALINMYKAADQYYIETAMGFCEYLFRKYGVDEMVKAMEFVWVDKITPNFKPMWSKYMGISGNDIESFMKTMMLSVDWTPDLFDVVFEPGKDRGVITCNRCIGVIAFEDMNWGGGMDASILEGICKADVAIVNAWTQSYNPDIVVKNPVLPPRKSKNDPCCVWEFTYKSK